MKHKRLRLYSMTGALLFALRAHCWISAAEHSLTARDTLCFDPGPLGSALESQAFELNPDSIYTSAAGFGWSRQPQECFVRRELSQSRTALTIDGVSGDRIEFRADIDPGTWYLTLWLETGRTDRHWPQVVVQGRRETLRWHVIRPPDEPSRSLQKTYRVFHCTTSVGMSGLLIELIGDQAPVRLLGVSLVQRVSNTKPERRLFLQQLESTARYGDSTFSSKLLRRAEASLRANPGDAFYAIWRQRLELMTMAERYYAMRGWHSADEETGLGMLDRQYQAIMLLDGLLMPEPLAAQSLTERAWYLRGKLLYWLGKERGGDQVIAGAQRDLQRLAEKYPDDQILAMYTGQRVDIADDCDCLEPTADAPAWSIAQREALCRLRQLIHWWVLQRQSESGELGGKFGDDVEMLRWWAPLCLAGDRTAIRGWTRLADGVWQSKHIENGYARKLADVEHAAEFVADTAPLMLLYSDDPRYAQRLAPSAKHFESLWTGTTADGNRFFRSAWFNSTELESDEPKGRDLEYNTRAVQALRYLAWRHPNPKLVELLHEWSMAWLSAAMRTDKGKPKGIIPASVRFADEAFNGDGPNWYQADMYWNYYEWAHYCGSLLMDQLLFTYSLTEDERLLQPMFMSLELIRAEESSLAGIDLDSLEEGSSAWAAANLIGCGQFWNVVEQWRTRWGDDRWDDLIMRHGTAYGRYQISGSEHYLVDGLQALLNDVRYNMPMKTTEAVYTDRVRVPGAELLKAMLTGDGVKDNLSPYYAVSWQQTDSHFTALVRDASSDRLDVQLFYHGPKDREVLMRVWLLARGNYQLRCEADGINRHETAVTVPQPGHPIPITLPSQRLLRVTLKADSTD